MISRFIQTILFLLIPSLTFAAGRGAIHTDPVAPVILGVTSILLFALLGRLVARKLDQPSVLGELIMGIFVGNIFYFFGLDLFVLLREGPAIFEIIGHVLNGQPLDQAIHAVLGNINSVPQIHAILTSPDNVTLLQVVHVIDVFSRYGIIFMLFLVGLKSSIKELHETGMAPMRVALIGVLAPMGLGFIVTAMLMPHLSLNTDLFIAATLSATSVGITARVLADLNQANTTEANIILGAAVIDDILGLVLLAILTGMITSGVVELAGILKIIFLATLFLGGSFILGPSFIRFIIRFLSYLDLSEAKLFVSFLFVMTLAWFANLVGLATIVGAFAAGLILHEGYFHQWGDDTNRKVTIKDLVSPLEAILVPIFFVLVGIQVKLETFMNPNVILLAAGLLIAAILGKLVCGLGASKKYNRMAIGYGMLPRGEVGLVFASIGKTLEVITDDLFAAVVLMVIVTTLLAPPLLKRSLVTGIKG